MKKLTVLFLLFSSVACYGEIVSEVSFNPSRMGDYKYLKVADSATLVGGLVTDDLNISSGGTVTMRLGSSAPQNFTITGTPISVKGASGSTIDMPAATFRRSSSAYIPNVYVTGGSADFKDSAGVTSSVVNTMEGANILKQHTSTLSGGTVTVNGSSDSTSLYSQDSTKGFWLHGNDIPTPVGTSLEGATSISSCKLTWEERTTAETSPKKAKVLVLAECIPSGSGIPFEPIDPDLEPKNYRWVLTNTNRIYNAGSGNVCGTTCARTLYTGVEYNSASDFPAVIAAGDMIPECMAGVVGDTCLLGTYTFGTETYCPIYTCQE